MSLARAFTALALSVALILLVAACGGDSNRSATLCCKAFYETVGPSRSVSGIVGDPEQEPLTYILARVKSPQGLPRLFQTMTEVAPDEVVGATKSLRRSSLNWQEAREVPKSIDASRSFVEVDRYLARHCPANSPLAMRALVFNASP
jgi:hypothetical protein